MRGWNNWICLAWRQKGLRGILLVYKYLLGESTALIREENPCMTVNTETKITKKPKKCKLIQNYLGVERYLLQEREQHSQTGWLLSAQRDSEKQAGQVNFISSYCCFAFPALLLQATSPNKNDPCSGAGINSVYLCIMHISLLMTATCFLAKLRHISFHILPSIVPTCWLHTLFSSSHSEVFPLIHTSHFKKLHYSFKKDKNLSKKLSKAPLKLRIS